MTGIGARGTERVVNGPNLCFAAIDRTRPRATMTGMELNPHEKAPAGEGRGVCMEGKSAFNYGMDSAVPDA